MGNYNQIMNLILINGPSGIGKSTISARLAAEMPNTIVIDIDELRRSIPNYKENRKESLRLSYEHAKEKIIEQLISGGSVIVDKAILDSAILDSYIEEGRRHGAEVHEFFLFTDKQSLQQRADERGYKPGSLLTRERVGEMWEEANKLRQERTGAMVIDTTSLDLEETLEEIKNSIVAN